MMVMRLSTMTTCPARQLDTARFQYTPHEDAYNLYVEQPFLYSAYPGHASSSCTTPSDSTSC